MSLQTGRIGKRFGREVHPRPDARSLPTTPTSKEGTYQNELSVITGCCDPCSGLPAIVGQDKCMEAVIDRTIISDGNAPVPD